MQQDDGYLEKLSESDLTESSPMYPMIEKNPGLVFRMGEKVRVKDGEFRIVSLGRKRMILEGVPGTRIIKSDL